MSEGKVKYGHVIPVLISFFVMSFVDLVGTGVDEIRQDNSTPAYILQLIPFVAFIWFFILSVPVGVLQDKIGKRKALNLGVMVSAAGLLVPLLGNSLPVILVAFALLGMGNTVLQVSANPLLVDVVPGNRKSSYLSLSQSVKAAGSMAGPFVAGIVGPWLARLLGDESEGSWRYGLYLFALVSILVSIWLSRISIEESPPGQERASIGSSFRLLSNNFILMMVVGIFLIVGIDVAMNSNIATYLEGKEGIEMEEGVAKFVKTLYFFAKVVGALLGALLLTRIAARKFLIISSVLLVLSTLGLLFIQSETGAWIMVALVSLGVSNIFPIIFSISVSKLPDRSNEISGLMMMAISGGAIIPFLVGYAMEITEKGGGGIMVLLACASYFFILSMITRREGAK